MQLGFFLYPQWVRGSAHETGELHVFIVTRSASVSAHANHCFPIALSLDQYYACSNPEIEGPGPIVWPKDKGTESCFLCYYCRISWEGWIIAADFWWVHNGGWKKSPLGRGRTGYYMCLPFSLRQSQLWDHDWQSLSGLWVVHLHETRGV